ncbi:MAG TPA: hypothetical protein VJH03_22505 [Blastocatellia bacterium]|nr:hypothetical protein [Blastocatellia bacterium]
MNTMRFMSRAVCLILVVSLSTAAQWEKKPPAEWTMKEVDKVLNDSPWGKTMTFSTASELFRQSQNQGRGEEARSVTLPQAVHLNFRVRFLSAKPVRLAVKRMMELKLKDKMSPEMADMLKKFVSGDFVEYILVTVVAESAQSGLNVQEANSLLQRMGTANLKNNTFLESNAGQRLFLQEYQTPRDDGLGARFLFARTVNGKPFITPESGDVRFYSELSPEYRLDRRFKAKDMMYEGKLEY